MTDSFVVSCNSHLVWLHPPERCEYNSRSSEVFMYPYMLVV